MTDAGTARLVAAMAGAQKLLMPKWLYEALTKHLHIPEGRTVSQISYIGGALPIEVSESLPEDVLVIMERSGGLSAVRLERTHATADGEE